MDIPAHRAAAVVPTPAHSFELRDGDQLVNLTEEERTAAEASAATAAAVPAPSVENDPPVSLTGEESTVAEAADAAAAATPVRATKGRRPAADASAQTAE